MRQIRLTLILGLFFFLIISLTTSATSWIFYFMREFGLITEKNFRLVWMFDFAAVCTILGSLISIIAVHYPAKKMTRLLDAMDKITDGDFSVRLTTKYRFDKLSKKTITIFNTMARQLESTEMLSHDFINNFSHEFKTPIASINGFAKLLKNDKLSLQEKHEYLDIIIQESERLSNLSINILTLSKLEQQTILTNKTEYNLAEQIRIIIGSLYQKWSAKGLDINFEGEDIFILANKEMLGQVWINLLDNAIKFSPENKEIIFRLTKTENEINISIKNYGRTVASEQTERFFDKFYQGDESHSTSGNGLGLPMVKRIVELHEGEISVTSSDEPAVTFSIIFPAE